MGYINDELNVNSRRRTSGCRASTMLAVDTYLRAFPSSLHHLKQQAYRDVYLPVTDADDSREPSMAPRLSVFTRNMRVQGGLVQEQHAAGQTTGKTIAAASIRAARAAARHITGGEGMCAVTDGQ